MEIKILGSNSEGNCYIINNELLLDAGVHIKEIKQALNFDLSNIQACLITHSHKDHSRSVKELINLGIDVKMTKKCIEELKLEYTVFSDDYLVFHSLPFTINKKYFIYPFHCTHDVDCTGYIIKDLVTKEVLLFATDTMMLPYYFKDVNYYLIEANYSNEIIEKKISEGKLNATLADRVFHTHFSLDNCIDFLQEQDLKTAKNIILIHLSDGNSNEKDFIEKVEQATGIKTDCANARDVYILGE